MDQRVPKHSKNWQWTTEDDVSARRLIPAPHGGEWAYSFSPAVGITLVYCYRCTNATFVNSLSSAAPWTARKGAYTGYPSPRTIDGCFCNGLMSIEPGKLIGTKLSYLMNHASFLWNHDGRFPVRHYGGQRCLPEYIIELHSSQIPIDMVWGVTSYYRWSNLSWNMGNLNSNRHVREVLQPQVVPFLQGIPGVIFQQNNACPHVAKTI